MGKGDDEIKIIDEKKVTIKTKPAEVNAWAKPDGKTIVVTEKIKTFLNKEEYNAILLHERGHLSGMNTIIALIPFVIAIFLSIWIFFNFNQQIMFVLLRLPTILGFIIFVSYSPLILIIGILIELPCSWIVEILADRYSIKRTNKGIFGSALKKVYDYNNQLPFSFNKIYSQWVLHPPIKIRLWLIRKLEAEAKKGEIKLKRGK